jgi:hypothetical protein
MPHYSFLDGPFRLAMGLHALELRDWIETGPDADHQMAERCRLLAERPAEVVAALPESVAGQRELLALLLEHLPQRFPELWRRDGAALINRTSDERFDAEEEPLAAIGRMVQEDFCLMQASAAGYRLVAAVLCFPAHWRLSEKLGRPLDAIHEPVPGFAERLAGPVDRFFGKLQALRPVWRVNWSLVDTPELFRPPEDRARPRTVGAARAGEQLWLRVERQTLRRLQHSGDVVFGIRTYVEPLAQRIREMPPATATYKGIAPIREPLLAYLEQRAAAAAINASS